MYYTKNTNRANLWFTENKYQANLFFYKIQIPIFYHKMIKNLFHIAFCEPGGKKHIIDLVYAT